MDNKLNKHIEITPGVRSGKPRIAGTRIAVADVAIMYLRMGQSLEEIAGKYQLSLASVHAAMAFYYDHREEIDQRTAEAEACAEADRLNHPSLLKEKQRLVDILPGLKTRGFHRVTSIVSVSFP